MSRHTKKTTGRLGVRAGAAIATGPESETATWVGACAADPASHWQAAQSSSEAGVVGARETGAVPSDNRSLTCDERPVLPWL